MINNIFEAIGWTLLHSIWQISLIVLLIFFLFNSKHFKNAGKKYMLGVLGLFLILLCAISTFLIVFEPGGPNEFTQSSETLLSGISGIQQQKVFWEQFILWIGDNIHFITSIWAIGFILYSIRLLGGMVYIQNLKNRAVILNDQAILLRFQGLLDKTKGPSNIALYVSEHIISPITFGIYRSSIVLPLSYINQVDPIDLELILAHELAHILRQDFLINLFVNLIKTSFYFHPAVWWLVSRIEVDREKATDELAIRITQKDEIRYAKALLHVQEILIPQQEKLSGSLMSFSSISLNLFKSKNQLLHRIENLLGITSMKNQYNSKITAFILIVGILLSLGFSDMIIPGRDKHPSFADPEIKKQEIKIEKEQAYIPKKETVKIKKEAVVKFDKQIKKRKETPKNLKKKEVRTTIESESKEIELTVEYKDNKRIESSDHGFLFIGDNPGNLEIDIDIILSDSLENGFDFAQLEEIKERMINQHSDEHDFTIDEESFSDFPYQVHMAHRFPDEWYSDQYEIKEFNIQSWTHHPELIEEMQYKKEEQELLLRSANKIIRKIKLDTSIFEQSMAKFILPPAFEEESVIREKYIIIADEDAPHKFHFPQAPMSTKIIRIN